MKIIERYELSPTNGRKSFYGKAVVKEYADGTKVLQSYQTDVIKMLPSGELIRLWDDWSATTGAHIKSFCGLDKKRYLSLPYKGKGR